MKLRMVDRILSWERDRQILGVKAVSFEEYCAKAPLGDAERLPESLMLQSLLQLGNWLLILSSGFTRMGLITELDEVRFAAPVLPGQRLALDVFMQRSDGETASFAGIGRMGQSAAVCVQKWRVQCCALDLYYDPRDLRVLYEEICRPATGAPT